MALNPLDEFANSPRRFRNDDGSEIVSSSLMKLGPGLVASRPATAPGEPSFAILDAPSVATLTTSIIALESRVAALEAMLAGAGTLIADTLEVRRIIAKGTGSPPDANVADLQIVTKTVVPNVYNELIKFVGRNETDMDPAPKMGFFAGTANPLQTLPPGWLVGDLQARLENYNFVVEVP